jgi:hypothetical protein
MDKKPLTDSDYERIFGNAKSFVNFLNSHDTLNTAYLTAKEKGCEKHTFNFFNEFIHFVIINNNVINNIQESFIDDIIDFNETLNKEK